MLLAKSICRYVLYSTCEEDDSSYIACGLALDVLHLTMGKREYINSQEALYLLGAFLFPIGLGKKQLFISYNARLLFQKPADF